MTNGNVLFSNHTTYGRIQGHASNGASRGGEPGAYEPQGSFLFVKHPSAVELEQIYALTLREIGDRVAAFDVVKSVYGRNPISFWAFMRARDNRRTNSELVGYCAFLPLRAEGLAALKANALDPGNPAFAHLAPAGEVPAALYIWSVVAHGTADLGGKLIGHAMGLDLYERLPIYGSVATPSGLRALQRRENSPQAATATIGSAFEVRHPKAFLAEMRGLDVHWPGVAPALQRRPRLEASMVASADQIAKAFAVRAAVFLAEQNCPYDEEFDGNDYAGAHILGLVDGEPAAVLRIRYFADFVKLERLAVLPRFRRTLIAKIVVEQAIALCRRKGYTKMYGHAQKRMVGLWERFGFAAMNKNTPLVFSDHEYVEMLGEIPPHAAPLTPYSDPYVLIRPEGHWDAPGVLDRSASRLATNPNKDRHAPAGAR